MIPWLGVESEHVTAALGADCLDDLAALAFVEGTCTPARRTQILEHVDTCVACQELVAGVVAMVKEHDTLLATADTAPGGPPSEHEMIGPYRLGPQIAQGGMGRIYRAYDTSLGRDVALKLPRSGNDALARRFEREAGITAQLEHPGIVPIHGAGQTPEGTPFYVMRFIEGRTLDALIEEAVTPSARLALVDRVLELARTMAYVHSKRIVHRDLKPNNVLAGAFGETLIIDWGLAKQLSDGRASLPVVSLGLDPTDTPATREALRTRAGEVMGTPSFMPPEQAIGEPVDERADVYALGAILRNVVTGTLPRDADAPFEGPALLVEVCRRAMAWEAAGRYPDAGAFAKALEIALAAARPTPAATHSRVLIWLAAGSTVVALAIVVIMVLARRDALVGKVTRHVVARQPPDALNLALSPSGTRVAYGGRDRFYVLDIKTGKTWARTDWTLWPWVIEFQSDDDVIYSASMDHVNTERVHWHFATDQIERVASTSLTDVGHWLGDLRDGGLYMPADNARHLEIWRGGERQKLPSESVRQLRIFAIAPTRDRVAFVDHRPTGPVIRICNVDGQTFTSPLAEDVAAMTWQDGTTLYYTTGTNDGSTLWRAEATPQGLATPKRVYQTESGGWLGSLAARPGRVIASWITSAYETRLFYRATRSDAPLNKTAASAALAWLDATTYLAYSSSSGVVEKHSTSVRVLPVVTALALPSEPINATRAGDIVIATLRGNGGRTVVAGTLTDPKPRWTAPAGTLAFVRCAGDRQRPCVAGKQDAAGVVTLVSIDPDTGALGTDVIAQGVITDASVSADGSEVAWIAELRAVFVRPFDRSAPERSVPTIGAGNHTIAHDPAGGLLATGFMAEGRRIMRYHDSMQTSEVMAGTAIVSLVRPSPDGEYLLYRSRTLTGDLVEIR